MSTVPPERAGNSTEALPASRPLADLVPPSPSTEGGTVLQATPSRAALATGPVSVEVPGYEILGELGRGGMGAVLKGRDSTLCRDLAVKVLLERCQDDPQAVGRFVEEAQIGGRLQHPGVVPVYALGQLTDGRPYFTMKLIEGRTLAALLQERIDPSRDRPRFLKVFEQVCQTTAYAHSRSVIHRDLKPLNIMVGAFGEVQVMDWGLAKALAKKEEDGGVKKEFIPAVPSGSSLVATASSFQETQAGAVLGTPAYMAPEQARGEPVDARCDVFGLGAILCVILTGQPPYSAGNAAETVGQARRGDLAEAFARLDASGADAELVGLAKACLAAEPAQRPADAGAVAEAVTAHLAGVQERLHQAELAKAAAQAKAVEERKRRRLTLVLAATVLLAVCGVGAAALWYQQDRAARAAEDARLAAEHARKAANTERDVTAALEEATAFAKQAKGLHDDPARWEAALVEARSAVMRADGVLNNGEDDTGELRSRVDAQRAELEAADRDRRMIARLEEARFQRTAAGMEGGWDNAGAITLYAVAFHDDDLDPAWLEPAEAAARINRRAIRDDLLAALADWSNIAATPQDRDRLRGVLKAADPDPTSFRNRYRMIVARKHWIGLRKLAADSEAKTQPAATLASLGRQLTATDGAAEAVEFLKEANEIHPGDFWIAFELAYASSKKEPPATDEAIRYYTAALMVRPGSPVVHNNLGVALAAKHQWDEAIAEYRKALQIQPDYAHAHNNLGNALRDKHQWDEAIAEYRKAIELKPDYADAHNNLGLALRDKHQLDEAIAEYRKAIELKPDYAHSHNNLGLALQNKGQLDEAIAEFRKAVQIQPDFVQAHNNLGLALNAKHQPDEAIAEFRKAVQIQPDYANAHYNLGLALQNKGRLDEAIAEYRKALQIQPEYADAHNNLGNVLQNKGQLDEAIAEFRKAVQIQPEYAYAHNNLGFALRAKGQLDEAIAEYRKALQIHPGYAIAHNNLGFALYDKHQPDEAIAEYRKAIELNPDCTEAHYNLAFALYAKGQSDEAIAEYRKALQIQPDLTLVHNNLGVALQNKGQWDEAIAEYRKALQIQPGYAVARNNLGNALDLAERDALLPAILRGEAEPADAVQMVRFADFCQRYKKLDAAAAHFYADAFAADPGLAEDLSSGPRYNAACAAARAGCGQGKDAAATDAKERGRWRDRRWPGCGTI